MCAHTFKPFKPTNHYLMTDVSVFCDESCHLEHDASSKVMTLGCVWVPKKHVRRIASELKEIKEQHKAKGELKWIKVAPSYIEYYEKVIDWFLQEPDLHFRAVVIPDKTLLDHETFNDGSHDKFYYKSYFSLLSKILSPPDVYEIYLDIKDTRSRNKILELRDYLCSDKFDFTGQMIRQIRSIRSHESQLLQLCDLLLGAVTYRHRQLKSSDAKLRVIDRLEKGVGRSLLQTTPLYESKLNIFVWDPQKRNTQ